MLVSKAQHWRLGIAAVSLSAAVAVYCLARYYPPVLLEPLQATQSTLAARPDLFGSLPSLFYILAMGLLVGLLRHYACRQQAALLALGLHGYSTRIHATSADRRAPVELAPGHPGRLGLDADRALLAARHF